MTAMTEGAVGVLAAKLDRAAGRGLNGEVLYE
jgi:hypothetical protein